MKKIIASLCMACAANSALAENVYFGAGLGIAKAVDAESNIDEDMNSVAALGLGSSVSAKRGALSPSLLIGYRINSNFSVEIAYDYLGTYKMDAAITSGATTITGTETDKVSAVSLSALLSAPLTKSASVYGRIGMAATSNKSTCTSSVSACASTSSSGNGVMFGIGGTLTTSARSAFRLEYAQLNDVGDKADQYTAGTFAVIKLAYLHTP